MLFKTVSIRCGEMGFDLVELRNLVVVLDIHASWVSAGKGMVRLCLVHSKHLLVVVLV